MPVLTVQMWKGRTEEQKRAMVKALTEAMVETTGTKIEAVHVIIQDVSKSDWGIGGDLCSDKF
jgi:4-oxalocrotonate tautomerase